eukprot:9502343-Alexandrium_andersonii.AAC.1
MPHFRQALAAHVEPRSPDVGQGRPRTNASSNDGFASIAARVIAMVPVAAVGTAGPCMCSERLAHVRLG